jgi:hypothetical protein
MWDHVISGSLLCFQHYCKDINTRTSTFMLRKFTANRLNTVSPCKIIFIYWLMAAALLKSQDVQQVATLTSSLQSYLKCALHNNKLKLEIVVAIMDTKWDKIKFTGISYLCILGFSFSTANVKHDSILQHRFCLTLLQDYFSG